MKESPAHALAEAFVRRRASIVSTLPRGTRGIVFGKSFVYVLIASQGPVQFLLSSENCRGL